MKRTMSHGQDGGVEGRKWREEERKGKGGGQGCQCWWPSERLVAWPEGETVNGSRSAGRRGELWSGWLTHTHKSDHQAAFSHGI